MTAELYIVDGSGEQRWSISDEVGSKVTYSTTVQALCLSWMIPAIGLVWTGFATIGLRSISAAELAGGLERIQAVVVMLAIFTMPIGCIWALRTWPSIEGLRAVGGRRPIARPGMHAVSLAVAAVALLGMQLTGWGSGPFAIVASAAGFHAALLLARWLQHAPVDRTFPLVALSVGACFQATIGWQHILNPNSMLAPLLVIEGLGLAWAAIAAARVVRSVESGFEQTVAAVAEADETASTSADPEPISQAPALQPLPEPAVGR